MTNSKSTRSNTGYKGIHFNKQQGNFRSRVILDNTTCKSHQIGMFDTLKEAVKAREDYIKSLF